MGIKIIKVKNILICCFIFLAFVWYKINVIAHYDGPPLEHTFVSSRLAKLAHEFNLKTINSKIGELNKSINMGRCNYQISFNSDSGDIAAVPDVSSSYEMDLLHRVLYLNFKRIEWKKFMVNVSRNPTFVLYSDPMVIDYAIYNNVPIQIYSQIK